MSEHRGHLRSIRSDAETARASSALEKYDGCLAGRRDSRLRLRGPLPRRAAYRFITESTIYLRNGLQGQGLGKPLYRATIERIFALGYTSLIGAIALPNDASVALHESLGFEKVGHLRRVGWKHERWIDVGSWQLEKPPGP
jgi:RimJ/RimL family protein N-acetyltransferase